MSERAVRVLLVDDDESFRRVQEYQLVQAGYDVVSAGDGETALDRFREGL
jgi:OmpR family response regulator RpaB